MSDNARLLSDLGIDLKNIKDTGKTVCPKCSHTRKKKTDPCLSINIKDGLYKCHNCGWSGGVVKNEYSNKVEYTRPSFVNNTELSDKVVKFFQSRMINQETLNHFKITSSNRFFPQINTSGESINFNYFRNNELINVKYRGPKKSFMMYKGAELIFYNIDSMKNSDEIIIVEGEIDAMSVHQAGFSNVISVPNGATLSDNPNLEYLDSSIDYFNSIKKIIIATDNDEPGRALRKELSRRLGSHRCYMVDFGEYKDANDVLMFAGADKLKEIIKSNKETPISGVLTADDVWEDLEVFFENGLSRGDTTLFMPEFDKLVSFVPGHTMAITGIPNHGKSLLTNKIMCSLAVNHGWKWAIFSPEHKPLSLFVAKLCEILIGKRMRKGIGFSDYEKSVAKKFINDHFYFIEPEDEDYSLTSIIDRAKSLVFRKGIRGFVLDPWNKIEHKISIGEQETTYISRALDEIISFGQKNSVFNIIVAHPTKIKKSLKTGLHEVATLYDIAGSANFFNKVDWGISFYRNFSSGLNEIYVQKSKWEHLGSIGFIECRYNVNNGRLKGMSGDWDNSNWLIKNNPQPDLFEYTNDDFPEVIIESTDVTESPF